MSHPPLPISVPAPVRRAQCVPSGPLVLMGVWAMGDDLRGLWVALAHDHSRRTYPITRVRVSQAQAWLDAAQRGVA